MFTTIVFIMLKLEIRINKDSLMFVKQNELHFPLRYLQIDNGASGTNPHYQFAILLELQDALCYNEQK